METRQEQDEMIENLKKRLVNIEQTIDQTNNINDVGTLDQTYEV